MTINIYHGYEYALALSGWYFIKPDGQSQGPYQTKKDCLNAIDAYRRGE
jgi:hypothetical protein